MMLIRKTKSFFFFFQAEDGIRDGHVTGVQTCALPILTSKYEAISPAGRSFVHTRRRISRRLGSARSEERRVGKECRSRGAARHEKKKKTAYDIRKPQLIHKHERCK